jgi:hypothetical protein
MSICFVEKLSSKSRAFLIHDCNLTPFHHGPEAYANPAIYVCLAANILPKRAMHVSRYSHANDLTGLRGIAKLDQTLRLEKMEVGCVVILSNTKILAC